MRFCSCLLTLLFAVLLARPQSSDVPTQLQRAGESLRQGDAKSAATLFEAVLRSDPDNVEAHANLGVIAFFQNDYPRAASHLREALKGNGSLVKVQALLGICEHRMGDPSAVHLLEQSFPHLDDAKLKTQTGLELANIYYQHGDLERAANVMQPLVDIDPDNVNVLFLTQQIYTELAEGTLNKLAILAPNSARMQQVIAERLINEGDLTPAIEHYKKALAIDPKLPGARLELAEAILQSAPSDESVQAEGERQLQLAMQSDGDSAKIECVLAGLALRRADTAAADEHFRRALELNPQSVEAQIGVVRSLMSAGKADEALPLLEKALEADPLNSEAHYRLAGVYRKLGNSEAAHKEATLFDEIKQTKSQIRDLYRQMNKEAPNEMQDFTSGEDKAPAR